MESKCSCLSESRCIALSQLNQNHSTIILFFAALRRIGRENHLAWSTRPIVPPGATSVTTTAAAAAAAAAAAVKSRAAKNNQVRKH